MKNVRITVLFIVHFFSATWCLAQDGHKDNFDGALIGGIGGLGGNSQNTPLRATGGTWATGTHTSAYSVGYRQEFTRLLSGAVTYVNHGHYDRHGYLTDHHSRDDVQAEVFMRKRPKRGRLEFRVGGGAAYHSETDSTGESRDDFQNRQGFGFVMTGVVDVDISSRLFVEGRLHRHFVLDRYDSTNVLLGLGVRLHSRNRRDELKIAAGENTAGHTNASKHSVSIRYGLGRLNSKRSETLGDAFQLAHERSVSRHFATAFSYLREGTAPELNRRGLAFQGVARQELAGALTLGLALGPYVNVDLSDFFQRQGKVSVDALFTASLDFRVARRLELGFSVNRPRSLTTLKNKPMTDVFQIGLKYGL